jgi:hypothetical protein
MTKPAPTQAKGAQDVGSPAVCRELDLRPCVATPNERVDDGWSEMARQFTSLVEPAGVLPPPVKWNGHDTIRQIEKFRTTRAHQRREGLRQ